MASNQSSRCGSLSPGTPDTARQVRVERLVGSTTPPTSDPMPSWYPALAEVADDPGAPQAVRDACRAAGEYVAEVRADRGRLRAAGDELAATFGNLAQRVYDHGLSHPAWQRVIDAAAAWGSVRGDAPSEVPETLASVEDVGPVCVAYGLTRARTVGIASRWRADGVEIVATDEDVEDEPFVVVHAIDGGWIAAFKEGTPSSLLSDAIRVARVPTNPREAR